MIRKLMCITILVLATLLPIYGMSVMVHAPYVAAGDLSKTGSAEPYSKSDMQTYVDNNVDDNPLYIGASRNPSDASNTARWQIKKIVYDTDNTTILQIEFADGTNGYNKVWTDRASYTYTTY